MSLLLSYGSVKISRLIVCLIITSSLKLVRYVVEKYDIDSKKM